MPSSSARAKQHAFARLNVQVQGADGRQGFPAQFGEHERPPLLAEQSVPRAERAEATAHDRVVDPQPARHLAHAVQLG